LHPLKREHLRDQILEYWQYAIKNDQDDDAWNTIGVNNMSLGKLSCAKKPLLKALKLSPKNPDYWFNVGLLYDKYGKRDLAIRLYKRALALFPKHYESLYNLAGHYFQAGLFEEAVAIWLQLITEHPYHFHAYAQLSEYYCKIQNFEAAKDLLEQVREKVLHDARALWHIVRVYYKIGEYQIAREILNKLCQADPKYFDFHFVLADIYMKEESYVEALDCIEKAINIRPFNLDSQFLKLTLKSKLDHKDFLEALEYTIQINPGIALQTLEDKTFKQYQNDKNYNRILSQASDRKQFLSKLLILDGSEFTGNPILKRINYHHPLMIFYNFLKLLGFTCIVFYFGDMDYITERVYMNCYKELFSLGIIQEVQPNNTNIHKMLPIIAQITDGLIISNTEFHRYSVIDESVKTYLEKNQIGYTLSNEGLFLHSDRFPLSKDYYKEIFYEANDMLYDEK